MNETTILALEIAVGAVLVYFILSQNRTMQSLYGYGQSAYRYEIERDAQGRMSGLAYIPIPIETRVPAAIR